MQQEGHIVRNKMSRSIWHSKLGHNSGLLERFVLLILWLVPILGFWSRCWIEHIMISALSIQLQGSQAGLLICTIFIRIKWLKILSFALATLLLTGSIFSFNPLLCMTLHLHPGSPILSVLGWVYPITLYVWLIALVCRDLRKPTVLKGR